MATQAVHGLSRYKKFGCRCSICSEAYEEYKLKNRKTNKRLFIPCDPLVSLLEDKFPGRALEMRDTLRRWKKRGTVDLYEADRICIMIGLHPYSVFGDLYFVGLEDQELIDS